jgi:hypothetical protein
MDNNQSVTDIAMSQNKDTGEILLHRADCPEVRQMAADGHPVMTMLGCRKGSWPDVCPWHSCITDG